LLTVMHFGQGQVFLERLILLTFTPLGRVVCVGIVMALPSSL
jgi:hypothetical protein